MAKKMSAAEKRLVHVLTRTQGWGASRGLEWLAKATDEQRQGLEQTAEALEALDRLPEILEPPKAADDAATPAATL